MPGQQHRPAAPAQQAAPAGGGQAPAQLQPAGNAAMQAQMGGGDSAECHERVSEADLWAAGGPYGPEDVIGAEGWGGFAATYTPNGGPGVLDIGQVVGISLKHTLVDNAGTVAPHADLPASADLRTIATGINALREPERSAALSEFQWAPDEHATWIAELEELIESSWGGQYSFFLNIPQWEFIGAEVEVDLECGERDTRGADDHLFIESYKVPEGQSLRSYVDDSTGNGITHNVSRGSPTNARDQNMRLASTTIGPKEYALLERSVEFGLNSAALTNDAQNGLRSFINTFEGVPADVRHQEISVQLTAHCSRSGTEEYNLWLAQRRADAVRGFLNDNGFSNVDTRVNNDIRGEADADQDSENPHDRRVDLVVDGGARMVTANHEWGHSIGLDDEYGTVGDDAEHDALVRDMTLADGTNLPGAVKEHNGGIMSYGNEVREHHYATFHKGLKQVTDKEPWSLGTRRRRADVEAECVGS